jgi:acetyl esterase
MIHPEVELLLRTVLRAKPEDEPFTVHGKLAEATRINDLLVGPGEPVSRTWDDVFCTREGPVRIRWYSPPELDESILLIFVHGGGWVGGSLDLYDTFCRALSLRSRRIVMAVEYSKSPDARHPKALYQIVETILQARDLAAKANVAAPHIAVCGDSAGGFLVIGALLHLAIANTPMPAAAIFLYPVLDPSLDFQSYEAYGTGFHLTTAKMRWYWQQYLGSVSDTTRSGRVDQFLAPLNSPHLSCFPRSLVLTAQYDPLHDEGAAFAQRLSREGVETTYVDVPGQIHGFLRFRKALTDPQWGPDALMTRISSFLDASLKATSCDNANDSQGERL